MTRFTKKRGVFSIKTLLILAIISILPRMEAKAAFNEIIQGQIKISQPSDPKENWYYYVIRNIQTEQEYLGVDLRPSLNPFEVGVYAFVQAGDNASHVRIYNKAKDQWVTYNPYLVNNFGNGQQTKQVAYLDSDPDHGYNDAEIFNLRRDLQSAYQHAIALEYFKSNKQSSGWFMNYFGGAKAYNPETNPQDRAVGAHNVLNDLSCTWVAESIDERIFCSISEMSETTRPEFVYRMRTVTNSEGGGYKVSPYLTWPGDNGQEAHFAFYSANGRNKIGDYEGVGQVGEGGSKYNASALYLYDCTKQKWVTHNVQTWSYDNDYWAGVGTTRVGLTENKSDRRKFLTIYEKVSANTASGAVAYGYVFLPYNGKGKPDFHNYNGQQDNPVVSVKNRSLLSARGYNNELTLCFDNKHTSTANGAAYNAWNVTEVGPDTKSIRDDVEKDNRGNYDAQREAAYQKEYTFDDLADFNVTIQRRFKSGVWNTICVPFNISGRKVLKAFGSDVRLREFYRVQVKDGKKVMFFKAVDEIQAGKPYLVLPPTDVTNPTFENVILRKGDAQKTTVDGISMVGVYGPTRLNEDGTHLFIGTNNEFKRPTPLPDNQTRGMRAYFEVPRGTNDATLRASIFDDITGIEDVDIAIEDDDTDAPVFDINGQRVGTGLNGLNRGVYIMGGKKYVVK